jgi:F420-non-reducing hydrogenase iron-sulfur subunit
MSAGEGILFAEVMSKFGKKVKLLGPLGKAEGIDERRTEVQTGSSYKAGSLH